MDAKRALLAELCSACNDARHELLAELNKEEVVANLQLNDSDKGAATSVEQQLDARMEMIGVCLDKAKEEADPVLSRELVLLARKATGAAAEEEEEQERRAAPRRTERPCCVRSRRRPQTS